MPPSLVAYSVTSRVARVRMQKFDGWLDNNWVETAIEIKGLILVLFGEHAVTSIEENSKDANSTNMCIV